MDELKTTKDCLACGAKHVADAGIVIEKAFKAKQDVSRAGAAMVEVVNGYAGDADHEFYILGNLTHAEEHLSALNPEIAAEIRALRLDIFPGMRADVKAHHIIKSKEIYRKMVSAEPELEKRMAGEIKYFMSKRPASSIQAADAPKRPSGCRSCGGNPPAPGSSSQKALSLAQPSNAPVMETPGFIKAIREKQRILAEHPELASEYLKAEALAKEGERTGENMRKWYQAIVEVAFKASAAPLVAAQPLEGTVDIVFPLASCSGGNGFFEFRMALRSIERSLSGFARIFVATDADMSSFTGLEIISCPDAHASNKDANLIDKVRAVCLSGVSSNFILWMDDQVLLTPLQANALRPSAYAGAFSFDGKWGQRFAHTLELLRSRGITSMFDWDTHIPQPMSREAFLSLTEGLDYQDGAGYCINTMYFGLQGIDPASCVDGFKVKHTQERALPVDPDLSGKQWLGYNDAGLPVVRPLLEGMFKEKSRFEK